MWNKEKLHHAIAWNFCVIHHKHQGSIFSRKCMNFWLSFLCCWELEALQNFFMKMFKNVCILFSTCEMFFDDVEISKIEKYKESIEHLVFFSRKRRSWDWTKCPLKHFSPVTAKPLLNNGINYPLKFTGHGLKSSSVHDCFFWRK